MSNCSFCFELKLSVAPDGDIDTKVLRLSCTDWRGDDWFYRVKLEPKVKKDMSRVIRVWVHVCVRVPGRMSILPG